MDIPNSLLCARRVLDGIHEYTLLRDWEWESDFKKWFLKFTITIDNPVHLERTTYWVVVVDPRYPDSEIDVFPDNTNGIRDTYPHQSNNGLKHKKNIWKTGKLCLDNQKFSNISTQPDDEYRLEWFILRTVLWVNKANNLELLAKGDWFELSEYNTTNSTKIAYDEDEVSFMIWGSQNSSCGFVELKRANNNSILCVAKYHDLRSKSHTNLFGETILAIIIKTTQVFRVHGFSWRKCPLLILGRLLIRLES